MSKRIILLAAIVMSVITVEAQQMCAQVITQMINPQTQEKRVAINSCAANELIKIGFVYAGNDDVISEGESDTKSNLSLITKGNFKVTLLRRACSLNTRCMPLSILELSLPLNGCVDSAHVTYKITTNAKTGKKTVLISALNVANEQSKLVRCIVQATARKSISLGAGVLTKNDVTVEFIQNVAQL